MKNKRVWVFCSALLLLAVATGVASASSASRGRRGSLNGVFWNVIEGRSQVLGNRQIGNFHIQVANMNDYPVRVVLDICVRLGSPDFVLAARETRHFLVRDHLIDDVRIRSVVRLRN